MENKKGGTTPSLRFVENLKCVEGRLVWEWSSGGKRNTIEVTKTRTQAIRRIDANVNLSNNTVIIHFVKLASKSSSILHTIQLQLFPFLISFF